MSDAVRAGLRISWISIAWSAVSGTTAIAVALVVSSLALLGSGASVLIDLTSSAVLVWRFRHPRGHEVAEHRAHLLAASALVTLGSLLAIAGLVRLASGASAHPDVASVAVAAASVVILPLIAQRKYRVAPRIPSRALAADGHITVVGALSALVSLIGLLLTHAGLPRADAVAGLVLGLGAIGVGVVELRGVGGSHSAEDVAE